MKTNSRWVLRVAVSAALFVAMLSVAAVCACGAFAAEGRFPVEGQMFVGVNYWGSKSGVHMGGEPVGAYHWGKGPAWNKGAKDNDVYKLRCDAVHLNKEGEYLQACTWLAALFDDDLSGLAYRPGFLTEEKAKIMRKCAVEAVSARKLANDK